MLRRTIFTDISAFGIGKMKDMAPDVTLKMYHPTLGMEVGTDELEALMINSDGEVLVFVMTPETKADLMRTLAGGLHVVGANEMPSGPTPVPEPGAAS